MELNFSREAAGQTRQRTGRVVLLLETVAGQTNFRQMGCCLPAKWAAGVRPAARRSGPRRLQIAINQNQKQHQSAHALTIALASTRRHGRARALDSAACSLAAMLGQSESWCDQPLYSHSLHATSHLQHSFTPPTASRQEEMWSVCASAVPAAGPEATRSGTGRAVRVRPAKVAADARTVAALFHQASSGGHRHQLQPLRAPGKQRAASRREPTSSPPATAPRSAALGCRPFRLSLVEAQRWQRGSCRNHVHWTSGSSRWQPP